MRLIITRHGETEENKAGILQGQTVHGILSEEGIMQAKKLALRLKDEKIDYVYSSDLGRAKDTALEIMKFHKEVPIEFVEEVRERNLGEFEGKSKKEVGWDKPEFNTKEFNVNRIEPIEGEAKELLYERARKFIHKIIKLHKKETVLIVAHGGINLAFLAVIMDKPVEEILSLPRQKNTAVNIFEIDEDRKYKLHVLNCIKHLDG